MKREREMAYMNRESKGHPEITTVHLGQQDGFLLVFPETSQNNVKKSLDSHGEIFYVHLPFQIEHSTYQVSLRVAHYELPSDP